MPINPKIKGHNGEVPHYLCIDSTNGKDYLHIGFIYDEGNEVRGDFMGQTIIIKKTPKILILILANIARLAIKCEKNTRIWISPILQRVARLPNVAIFGLVRIFMAIKSKFA